MQIINTRAQRGSNLEASVSREFLPKCRVAGPEIQATTYVAQSIVAGTT